MDLAFGKSEILLTSLIPTTTGQSCGSNWVSVAGWKTHNGDHDDIIKWKNNIFTLLALCDGNPLVTSWFPNKGQLHGTLMLSLICACTNGWANNKDIGDLRRHCGHNDVPVMLALQMPIGTSLLSFFALQLPLYFCPFAALTICLVSWRR